ncbi:MAG: hypothetical protein ABW185_09020 [Sedimenticola sp.]
MQHQHQKLHLLSDVSDDDTDATYHYELEADDDCRLVKVTIPVLPRIRKRKLDGMLF